MTRKRILILLMVVALAMACFFGCKRQESQTAGNDGEKPQVEDNGIDIDKGGAEIDFDDLVNAGGDEDNKPEDDKLEDDEPEGDEPEDNKPEDNKPEDNKPEDNKPEDDKPEDNKPEDNKPEDNKPEDNKPEDNKPEDNKPEQDDEQDRSGVVENEDTDVEVPFL